MPYSWLIEAVCITGTACFFLFYFAVWDPYIGDNQYAYSGFGNYVFIAISAIQILVVVYMILGEKCCYSLGPEACCTELLSCRKPENRCCRVDCCFVCVKTCTCCCNNCEKYWYCWCAYYPPCCCFGAPFFTPRMSLSPDYKQRLMTFLESLSLLLKLLHYYNFSTLNNAWYNIVFMILIFNARAIIRE